MKQTQTRNAATTQHSNNTTKQAQPAKQPANQPPSQQSFPWLY